MWEFFIKNDRFSYLFLIALVAVGSYSLIQIPKESAPEVVIPVGVVTTVLPGAPAADIENLITNAIERGLQNLDEVNQITSVSREGVSSITVEFNANADLDASIQDLKDEVDIIKTDLPQEAEDPAVTEVDFVDQPIMTIAVAADLSDFGFTLLADQLETELEKVSGVSRVETNGVRDREVTVLVDQTKLERFDLTLQAVTNALQLANRTFPIGQIVNDGVSYNVAFEGDITSPELIAEIPIANRGNQPVFVRDIATVENNLAPATSLSRLSIAGEPSQNSLSIDVYKRSGGDITTITAAVDTRIDELKAKGELLDGIDTITLLDSGQQVRDDLLQLSSSGLQTVVLVVLLLIIAIGWREGLLAGAAIPFSFLFSFIGLYFSGNTINFLSLFSLILGIGILVDSAIVMVEGINRKMKDNPTIDKQQAAIETIREFSLPLISGTLTTVSMFVGLFIVSGVIGQFIASIPFTLIFLLFASLFVALAIVPLFAAGFLKRKSATRVEQKQVAYAHAVETWYKNFLHDYLYVPKLQWRFLSLLMAGLVFALSLPINVIGGIFTAPLVYVISYQLYVWHARRAFNVLWRTLAWLGAVIPTVVLVFFISSKLFPSIPLVEVIFFAQGDVDFLVVEIENPEGTIKETTDIAARRVEELLYNQPYIESFTTTVGSGSQFGAGGTGEKFANIFIDLSADRTQTSSEIVTELRNDLAVLNDITMTVNQPSDGPPTGAAIVVKFLGDDLTEITSLATEAVQVFEANPDIINVETSTNSNNTEFVLNLDRAKAAAAGLDPFVVSQTARTALFGSDATELTNLEDDIDVVVRLNVSGEPNVTAATANRTSIDALQNITLPSAVGPIPLSSIVDVSLRESSTVINHEDSKRVVSITADVRDGANARDVQAAVLAAVEAQLDIPDTVTISTGGGETEDSNQAFLEMLFALIVGILLMVGVLVLQFNSYLHMRYVLSILPFSLIGIFFGLAVTDNPLSFPSIMGFIALSGIVVNNSILLIDMMNQLRKSNPHEDIKALVLQAAGSRLRPILLTTLTTVIGMVPLTYAGDLWAPLAYAVMFGLVFSVFVTLLLVPILYVRNPGNIGR